MKAKKPVSARRRVSFAVDRDEIEINSDWVEAVMTAPVSRAAPPLPPQPTIVRFPAPPSPPASEPDVFLGRGENNATGANISSGARCTSVENGAAVDNEAS